MISSTDLVDCSAVNIQYEQRKQRFLMFPSTPIRFTPPNPYITGSGGLAGGVSKFTEQQLAMRRKVEILKYNNTTSSTKTNSLTKSQRWAQIVNRTTEQPNFNVLLSASNDLAGISCPQDSLIPMPTTVCGIRGGPVAYLWEDPTVPLYNYITTRNYGTMETNIETQPWKWASAVVGGAGGTSVLYQGAVNTHVLSIYITPAIEVSFLTFRAEIPIYVEIEMTVVPPASSFRFTFDLYSYQTTYSDVVINTYGDPSLHNEQLYDLSFQSLPIINNATTTIYIKKHIGTAIVSGIKLATQPEYIYKMTMSVLTSSISCNGVNVPFLDETTTRVNYGGNSDLIIKNGTVRIYASTATTKEETVAQNVASLVYTKTSTTPTPTTITTPDITYYPFFITATSAVVP